MRVLICLVAASYQRLGSDALRRAAREREFAQGGTRLAGQRQQGPVGFLGASTPLRNEAQSAHQ